MPYERWERWMAGRMMRHLEPHVESLVHRFLTSDRGQDLMASLMTEALTDLAEPSPHDGQHQDLWERLTIKLATRLSMTRPGFRRTILQALQNAHPPGEP